MTTEFIRSDKNKGAILSVDSSGLEAYKKARENNRKINDDRKRLDRIETDLLNLKKSINNIEKLLIQINSKGQFN